MGVSLIQRKGGNEELRQIHRPLTWQLQLRHTSVGNNLLSESGPLLHDSLGSRRRTDIEFFCPALQRPLLLATMRLS